jgi:hypothetical protein
VAASAIILILFGAIGAARKRIMIGRSLTKNLYLEGRAAVICGLVAIAIGILAALEFLSL